MNDDIIHIPDEDVVQHFYLPPFPEMSIPHGVHVFVLKDHDALHRALGNDGTDAAARSYVSDEPDAEGSRAVMYLTADALPVSIVAHEATHIILLWADADPNLRARRWLAEHPEDIAEGVGNLTAMIWYNIESDER